MYLNDKARFIIFVIFSSFFGQHLLHVSHLYFPPIRQGRFFKPGKQIGLPRAFQTVQKYL